MHNDAALRQKLFPYAYNILGSVEDSEDVLQNVIIKSLKKTGIENETAYLIRAVINESINFKKRRNRIIQRDVWLPEPHVTNEGEGNLESKEILQYSMLVLLERLNINERAVFLLKEAFGYSHQEISAALSLSIQNTRQLLSRAKKKLKARQFHPVPVSSQPTGYLEKYIATIRQGDVKTLESMLAGEIQVLADGGANLHVVAQTTVGIAATIELLLYVYNHYQKDFDIIITQMNHQPALLFYSDTKLINCQVFETNSMGKITQIFSVIDPLKLTKIERPECS